jgi:hypothetical protein
VRREAVLARWESVRQQEADWLKPFHDLPIDRAMAYLEDLRKVTEKAGHIMNERINADKNLMRCCNCKADLSGLLPNGRPKYMGKFDLRDKQNPEIIRSLYVCSSACQNAFARKHQGALGGTG